MREKYNPHQDWEEELMSGAKGKKPSRAIALEGFGLWNVGTKPVNLFHAEAEHDFV
jgi:hypothetical protein